MSTQTDLAHAVTCSALLGHCDDLPPVNREIIGAGICDLCGEQSTALKSFDRAPAAGVCYCRKCAPGRETDADWPNDSSSGAEPAEENARTRDRQERRVPSPAATGSGIPAPVPNAEGQTL